MAFRKHFIYSIVPVLFVALIFILSLSCDGGSDESGGNRPSPPPDINPQEPLFDGAIQGTVNTSLGFALNGVHVRAVKVDSPNIQISAFSGVGPGLTIRDGEFRIDGVPSGNYIILIEKLDGRSLAFQARRYSDFVAQENSSFISFPDEFFNGVEESSDDNPEDSVEITVRNGQTTGGIDFITNDVTILGN